MLFATNRRRRGAGRKWAGECTVVFLHSTFSRLFLHAQISLTLFHSSSLFFFRLEAIACFGERALLREAGAPPSVRTATVRIDSETAGVLSLGIDHFENVLASMGNQQEDVMRKVAELNSEREQANLRILGGAVPPPPPPPRNPPALQNIVVVETGKQ
jgi:CRP-like cAMP-binding protein